MIFYSKEQIVSKLKNSVSFLLKHIAYMFVSTNVHNTALHSRTWVMHNLKENLNTKPVVINLWVVRIFIQWPQIII